MSKYITEVILCNYDLSSLPSSFIAAISLYMALKFTKFIPNNKRVVRNFFERTPYKQDELESKFLTIIDLLKSVSHSPHYGSVREKYKREEFDYVASFDYEVDFEVKLPEQAVVKK
ncbi:unnamed protein product [Didymodactylos carnosus]|nr:unnamed protein product [Didymodactylos carnosus]CAF4458188.1 unnamed protein product [Didymodactylos carnosus]